MADYQGFTPGDKQFKSMSKSQQQEYYDAKKSSDAKSRMDDVERQNYDNLKKSSKNWSEDDARYMATNPSGRLYPDPDAKPTKGYGR